MTTVVSESDVAYGYVGAAFVDIKPDDQDAGDDPNFVPGNIKILFTRTPRNSFQVPIAPPVSGVSQAHVLQDKFNAGVMSNGLITDDLDAKLEVLSDATPGVKLPVGSYMVNFGGRIPDLLINVTEAHTLEAPLDLLTLIGYQPPVGTTVKTVALPSSGVTGQMLVLSGDALVWAEPVSGEAGPAGASVTGGVDNGDGTVSFTLSDGTQTDPVAVPPGPAGKSAYQLAVDGGFTGTLTEWMESLRGADGADSTVPGPKGDDGPPGPPPTLSMATPTKVASGGNPSASISQVGTTNEWEISLGLVDGSNGSPTAYELRGSGMPNGVVTATPGTYYTDTAGTNGAWRWLKKTGTGNTGWAVVIGDTGLRDITSWFVPMAETTTQVFFRATQDVCEIYVRVVTLSTFVTANSWQLTRDQRGSLGGIGDSYWVNSWLPADTKEGLGGQWVSQSDPLAFGTARLWGNAFGILTGKDFPTLSPNKTYRARFVWKRPTGAWTSAPGTAA